MSQLVQPEPRLVTAPLSKRSGTILPEAPRTEGIPVHLKQGPERAKIPSEQRAPRETDDSLFEHFAWLYIFFRENLFRDDTDRIVRALWPGGTAATGTHLIELGCGPGFYSCRLAERFPGLSILGVDRSPRQLDWAEQKARKLGLENCRFESDNVLDLSHADESFDGLLAARLFTVLPDQKRAIAEMHRVLRPGGRCLIAEPRYAFWASLPLFTMWALARLTRLKNGYREPTRATVLSAGEFRNLFNSQPWRQLRTWQDGRDPAAVACSHAPVGRASRGSDSSLAPHGPQGTWLQVPANLCALAVMTKAPLAGKVKTRLTPPLTPEEAAALNVCFLRDTAAALKATASEGLAQGVGVYTPRGAESAYTEILPPDFFLVPQRGDAFGERLLFAMQDLLQIGFASACLINSDSPTVPQRAFSQAARLLSQPGERIVLGPSCDGGYYLIGMKRLYRRLFEEIDWSTDRVFAQTMARAAEIGIEVELLPKWYDVDDRATLRRLCDELLRGEGISGAYPAPATHSFLAELIAREGRGRVWPNE
jgi:rSAM/selenodomain-associated transferase 1